MVARVTAGQAKKGRVIQKKKAGTAPLNKKNALFPGDGDVKAFLEDLDVEIESRCRLIEFEALRRSDELRNAFSSELIKLPKHIRSMPVKEFVDKFGGNIGLVLEEDRKAVLQATGFATGTLQAQRTPGAVELRSAKAISRAMSMRRTQHGSLKKTANAPSSVLRNKVMLSGARVGGSSRNSLVGSTPMKSTLPSTLVFATPQGARAGIPPPTPSTVVAFNNTKKARALRRGESLMSLNGSPILAAASEVTVASSSSSQQPGFPPAVPEALSTIALAIGDPAQLAQDQEAFSKLEALKDHVNALMDKLKSTQQQ